MKIDTLFQESAIEIPKKEEFVSIILILEC